MKLKNSKKRYDLFYVGDHVYFDNTIYRIVYSEGYIGYGYDIFKNKPNWEDDIVAINFEDEFEFIEEKRSTRPFNEVFFKGDRTIYFDEFANKTEVKRFSSDADNKELAVLYVVAKSKKIDMKNFVKTKKILADYYINAFEIEDGEPTSDKEVSKYVNINKGVKVPKKARKSSKLSKTVIEKK